MLNHEPIFVNGFSRGGTTILSNLLASDPTVCLLGETHQVFKGASITDSAWRVLKKCVYHDAPIIFGQYENFFSPRLVKPRKPLSRWAKRRIDKILYREKLQSVHPVLNQFKTPGCEYTETEIRQSRMLCKNIDGMVYASDAWAEMYPDATFYGLVRNGLAVCEGHVRRNRSAKEIGWRYQVLVDKMLADAKRLPRYRIVRFEDVVTSPQETLESLWTHAGLDFNKVEVIRMQARRVMDANGNHQLCGSAEWDVLWLDPADLASHFKPGVDANQIKRLTPADRDAFLRQAGRAMEELGYSTSCDDSGSLSEHLFSMSDPATLPPPDAKSTVRAA